MALESLAVQALLGSPFVLSSWSGISSRMPSHGVFSSPPDVVADRASTFQPFRRLDTSKCLKMQLDGQADETA